MHIQEYGNMFYSSCFTAQATRKLWVGGKMKYKIEGKSAVI
jgi:hypothetical protein